MNLKNKGVLKILFLFFGFIYTFFVKGQDSTKHDRGLYYGFHVGYTYQNINSFNIGGQFRYAKLTRKRLQAFYCAGANITLVNTFYRKKNHPGLELNIVYMSSFRKSDFGLYSTLGFIYYGSENKFLTPEIGVNIINIFTLSYGYSIVGKSEVIPYNNRICMMINVNNYWKLLLFRNYKKV